MEVSSVTSKVLRSSFTKGEKQALVLPLTYQRVGEYCNKLLFSKVIAKEFKD